jgi:hypothetical protein
MDPQLIAFVLPGIPASVRVARFHVRAALAFHDLGQFADDAAIITGTDHQRGTARLLRCHGNNRGDPRAGRRS